MDSKIIAGLKAKKLPELQAQYAELFGKGTKCPNKSWIVARLAEAMDDRAATDNGEKAPVLAVATEPATPPASAEPPADAAEPLVTIKPPRQSWKGKTIEELRQIYLGELKRPSTSSSRAYLVWSITQARKGKKRVGPPRQKREAGALRVIPLTMPREHVEALDAAWMRLGLKSRTECMRRALQAFLGGKGEGEVAGLFASAE